MFGHFLIPFDLPHFYETEVAKTGEVLEVTNKPGLYSAFVYSDRRKLEESVAVLTAGICGDCLYANDQRM